MELLKQTIFAVCLGSSAGLVILSVQSGGLKEAAISRICGAAHVVPVVVSSKPNGER